MHVYNTRPALYKSHMLFQNVIAGSTSLILFKLKMTKTVKLINKCNRGVHVTYLLKLNMPKTVKIIKQNEFWDPVG